MLIAVVLGSTLALAGGVEAATVVLPRPGQVGFAGLAQYGSLLRKGELGSDFGAGGGLAVRLRYRMRYERGLGLTFERHGFEVRDQQPADSLFAPHTATLLASGGEIYQMFGTRTRTVRMLSAGVGLAQISQRLNDKETKLAGRGVGDGLYVSAGAELEYFFWQSWAVDLSARYHAVFLNQTTNHDIQVGAGLIFYASY
jgi:hypothetical protein